MTSIWVAGRLLGEREGAEGLEDPVLKCHLPPTLFQLCTSNTAACCLLKVASDFPQGSLCFSFAV